MFQNRIDNNRLSPIQLEHDPSWRYRYMLKQKFSIALLVSLSLMLAWGCSTQSKIEKQVEPTATQKEAKPEKKAVTQTASENVTTETVSLKVSGMT